MTSPDHTLCPIPDMGYCIYEKCPYWDQALQECDADCLKDEETSQTILSEFPCTIEWTEDFD